MNCMSLSLLFRKLAKAVSLSLATAMLPNGRDRSQRHRRARHRPRRTKARRSTWQRGRCLCFPTVARDEVTNRLTLQPHSTLGGQVEVRVEVALVHSNACRCSKKMVTTRKRLPPRFFSWDLVRLLRRVVPLYLTSLPLSRLLGRFEMHFYNRSSTKKPEYACLAAFASSNKRSRFSHAPLPPSAVAPSRQRCAWRPLFTSSRLHRVMSSSVDRVRSKRGSLRGASRNRCARSGHLREVDDVRVLFCRKDRSYSSQMLWRIRRPSLCVFCRSSFEQIRS